MSAAVTTNSTLQPRQMVTLSKYLSKVLRHQAMNMGFTMGADGRVKVNELLSHPSFRSYCMADLVAVVDNNDKKRFEISVIDGEYTIRAVQGHSIAAIDDESLLSEIKDPSEIPVCIHGTYRAALPAIMQSGLSKMNRNHIHMAAGLPGSDGVISGMRKSCDVLIYIDVAKAMGAGIQFFKSKNGVILSKGIQDSGVIPVEYFASIVERS